MATKIGLLHMHVHLPGADSLKAKRRRLKPLLARLHREFDVSAAEVDFHDKWSDAMICCAIVSTEASHAQRSLQGVADWVQRHWRDVELRGDEIEVLQ